MAASDGRPAVRPPRRTGRRSAPTEAAQLIGLTAEAVTRWIGEPALRRPEGPAEIWLYTASACALDLVLYRDDAVDGGAGLRVAFAAARASGTERQGEAACLGEIAAAGPAAPAPRTAAAGRGGA